MEICSLELEGAGITAQGSPESVYFSSSRDANGFAALLLGVTFKSGELVPTCNDLFWFSLCFLVLPAQPPVLGEACAGLGHA